MMNIFAIPENAQFAKPADFAAFVPSVWWDGKAVETALAGPSAVAAYTATAALMMPTAALGCWMGAMQGFGGFEMPKGANPSSKAAKKAKKSNKKTAKASQKPLTTAAMAVAPVAPAAAPSAKKTKEEALALKPVGFNEVRPTGLEAPRGGKADDLKMISGVGPKIESTLNDLGIYHFDQIAAWTGKEVDWVDDYLQFSGRISREDWIKQATALAKGGRDEYVKVFGKEPR